MANINNTSARSMYLDLLQTGEALPPAPKKATWKVEIVEQDSIILIDRESGFYDLVVSIEVTTRHAVTLDTVWLFGKPFGPWKWDALDCVQTGRTLRFPGEADFELLPAIPIPSEPLKPQAKWKTTFRFFNSCKDILTVGEEKLFPLRIVVSDVTGDLAWTESLVRVVSGRRPRHKMKRHNVLDSLVVNEPECIPRRA